jgi:D-alanine-D-alanine ligase
MEIRLSKDGIPYVLDINPNCDVQPETELVWSAKLAGYDYGGIILKLCEYALADLVQADTVINKETAKSD